MSEASPFRFYDDPELPGWKRWELVDAGRYNGLFDKLSVTPAEGGARVRFEPGRLHSNLHDNVHGGALLGFVDLAMFAACRTHGILGAGNASTVDLSTHFIAGAPISGGAVEARVEILRETGRMVFLRGLIFQGDLLVLDFSGTIRKPSSK